MIKSNTHIYFNAFERKDITKLRELFDSEIVLCDWNIEVKGVENVLNANANIFNSYQTIQVNVISLYIEKDTAIGELIIILDGTNVIKVVDIIEFTDQGKIKNIRAYKG